jgi:hypothetical protein
MARPDPKEVQASLWEVTEKLNKASEPLPVTEQKQFGNRLFEVYNYVAAQVSSDKNLVNIMWGQSAHDARVKAQLEAEQKNLAEHQNFIEVNFDNADRYLKTIQLAGYALFFAVWGFTREWLIPEVEAVAAILMVVSAVIFVSWEIAKASVLVALLRKHAKIGLSNLDTFILGRSDNFSSRRRAVAWFAATRVWVWWSCVIPAAIAVVLLLGGFVSHLLCLL